MKRSIKTKLIITLSLLIAGALLIGGGLIIWQNTQQLRRDIFLDALTFSELTNDRVVTAFEQFYVTESFLQFRQEVNPLLGKNVDVNQIEIIGKSGELFYDSATESDVAYIGELREQEYDLDRSRNIKPSLLYADGTLVYVKKTADNDWLAVNANDELVNFPEGEVTNIIFPNRNARLSVVYTISYEALVERIYEMALSILAVMLLSIIIVSFFALYFAGKLVNPIKALEKVVVKLGEGQLGVQAKVESDDEIGVLADNFNVMSVTLKKNTKELLVKEALEKELDIARDIQQNMLPAAAPKLVGLDVSGSLDSATAIGGDIFDYLALGEKGEEGAYIFIADVTGHGTPAGMVANTTHASLYSYSKVFDTTSEIMASMNVVVHAKTKPNMFATALLTKWEQKQRKLKYCNAGHEEMVYYQASSGEFKFIGKGGMALGMMPDLSKVLKEEVLEIKKDDVLVLYTDGIPEAWKNAKENLGMEAMMEIVKKVVGSKKDAKGIREGILAEVTSYRSNYPQQDDITIIVMKGLG